MKIGCGTVIFREYPLRQALELIRSAGYDYVETQATAPFCPHVDVDRDDPLTLRDMVKEFGFKGISALWSTYGAMIASDKSVEYGKKCIQWACAAGIPVLNIGDGFKPREMSEDDAWRLLKGRLLEILEVAEKFHVYLAIEPHGTFSLTSSGLKRMMSLSHSKLLGINYDTANIHRSSYIESKNGSYSWKSIDNRENEVEVLRAVSTWVKHVHLKDIRGDQCVALGKGEVDVAGCVRLLKQVGYDGVLSLETEGEPTLEEGSRLITESLSYVKKVLADI